MFELSCLNQDGVCKAERSKDQFSMSSIQSPLKSFGVIFHQSWNIHPGIGIGGWISHKERAEPAELVMNTFDFSLNNDGGQTSTCDSLKC